MLYSLITSTEVGSRILDWIEIGALAIEVLAVVIIVVAIFYSTIRYLIQAGLQAGTAEAYAGLKVSLGRSLLLGLEILVAADIVRTVALEATLQSVAVLGLLVLIRTFLSWALVVEIEGRWPWQPQPEQSEQ
jgi:uncharacterized membrane protein